MTEIRRTVCNRDCPDACGIVATVEDGRVVRIRGDKDHPITRGFLCWRTSLFLATQYSPDRLTTLDALCAISGNIGVPGGGVSFYFKRRGAFDTSFIQGAKAAPRTVCEPLFGPEV